MNNNRLGEKRNFKKTTAVVYAASFFVPALILYVIFAANGVHQFGSLFGDKQILVTDLWHQYYPFLCELQEKLKTGGSLLYSNAIGMGINFLALTAYYCASPLNLITVLFPKEYLRDVLVIIVALKIGFSGLFCSIYLKKVFGRCDFSIVAFSSAFALCGYVSGYYWNIMWLDSIAMLPLVMLGVHMLIRENKFMLYTISLALSIIFNFYIGYMICIFTAIYFFCVCFITKVDRKAFLKKLGRIAIFSVIAIALTAFITLPTYYALGNSYSVEKGFPSSIKLNESFIDIIGRMASFNEPVPKDGLPNIYSTLAAVALLGVLFSLKKINLREKILTGSVLVFLMVSMNVNVINYIWHGFHTTNMVPYRYAFLFSFVVIVAGYHAFVTLTEERCGSNARVKIGKSEARENYIMYAVGGGLALLVSLCAIGEAETATVLGSIALGLVYVVILCIMVSDKKIKIRKNFSYVLCAVLLCEIVGNVIIAVPTVRVTTYSTYYYRGEEVESVLEQVDAESSYGRVETSQDYILNDPALYGYKGVSVFSSTVNYPVTKFLGQLGICAPIGSNRYYYETTSPLTNAFLGIERVIFKNMNNLNSYLEEEASEDNVVIYKNTMALPLGFMTADTLYETDLEDDNPFEVQNDLFRKATGLEGDLFTTIPLRSVAPTNMTVTGSENGKLTYKINDESDSDRSLKLNYTAPDDNPIYAYIDSKAADSIKVNGTKYKAGKRQYIFPAGEYEAEDVVTFEFTLDEDTLDSNKSCNFYVASFNKELFEEGMALLADEGFEITTYEDTKIEGTIEAKEDGVFYLSVPYEEGWTLYVDGVETEIVPFADAMIAVPLEAGEHEISLTYSPQGFGVGAAISLAGLAAFVIIAVLAVRKKKKETETSVDA
ncbi:MAG: YfhO family protein [Clostridia bacterium]|nr:YfhO family protein [Clostridia bacterium]